MVYVHAFQKREHKNNNYDNHLKKKIKAVVATKNRSPSNTQLRNTLRARSLQPVH